MLMPRSTSIGTRAESQFAQGFWGAYVNAYFLGGSGEPIGDAHSVISEAVCTALQSRLGSETLAIPVLFTERLSNRVLAGNFALKDGSQRIVINARFKVDPKIMAHMIVEEFAHAWQREQGVDFAAQRSQLAYDERPYEIEAKRIATEILGYDPDAYETYIQRDEPEGILYDRAG